MKNHFCIGCERELKSKNHKECINCQKRLFYLFLEKELKTNNNYDEETEHRILY